MIQNLPQHMKQFGFNRMVSAIAATPARMYGVCTTKSLDIVHVSEGLSPTIDTYQGRPHDDPHRHEEFIFRYLLTETDFQNTNWLQLARRITAWISVILGKSVSEHKLIQANTTQLSPMTIPKPKLWNREIAFFSDDPRVEALAKLDYSSLAPLENVVFNTTAPAMNLHSAAEFYAMALRWWIDEPEQAYVSLVTAGECLCGLNEFAWDDLADENAKKIRQALLEADAKGKLARSYESSSRFIGERFVRTLLDGAPDSLFDTAEYAIEPECRFTREQIRRSLKNAYVLRSKYVHTGANFGVYTSVVAARAKAEVWHDFEAKAVPHGHSEAVGAVSPEIVKTVRKAATFIGLERVVRSAILTQLAKLRVKFQGDVETRFSGPLAADANPLGGRWVAMPPEEAGG